jgi:hypothetical protein
MYPMRLIFFLTLVPSKVGRHCTIPFFEKMKWCSARLQNAGYELFVVGPFGSPLFKEPGTWFRHGGA